MKGILISACAMILNISCGHKTKSSSFIVNDAGLLNRNEKELTQVIIYDVFSPPVASRIYMYTSLAAFEAIRFQKPGSSSVAANMHGFGKMPEPDNNKKYDFLLAATKAFFTVAEKITFSIDSLKQYQNKVYSDFAQVLNDDVYQNSIAFGEIVGKKILERAADDQYRQTRGMPKFLGSNDPGKWRPTPPDYMDAAEPHWYRMQQLTFDSMNQVSCAPPPAFNMNDSSRFYQSVKEVYQITTNLTPEQKEIAYYWDDNPFVVEHSGHLMYANKKITPVGHWIGITGIASKLAGADAWQTAKAYALTSAAIYDVIISCWKTKYEYQHIRPISVINEYIDPDWQPLLQTPPFPEHSSGHSGISAAAATVLTHLYGDHFSFEDTSDLEYIGMKRRFNSFQQAADEASVSRVYGGIHYRTGVEAGAVQGRKCGELIIKKFLSQKNDFSFSE